MIQRERSLYSEVTIGITGQNTCDEMGMLAVPPATSGHSKKPYPVLLKAAILSISARLRHIYLSMPGSGQLLSQMGTSREQRLIVFLRRRGPLHARS